MKLSSLWSKWTTPAPAQELPPAAPVEDVSRAAANHPLAVAPTYVGSSRVGRPRPEFPFALDNPWAFWLTYTPKKLPGKPFSVDTLRAWADSWDPLRSVLEYIKGEVASIPIKVVARDGSDRKLPPEVAAWFEDDGPLGGVGNTRRVFESKMLEDMLIVGQYAVWYQKTRRGKVLMCDAIDAGTIKPAVDALGWINDEKPFEQWIMGVKAGDYDRTEMRVDGLVPRTHTPYFTSPVEWAVRLVLNGVRLDDWNSAWLTEGNVGTGDTISLGGEMSPSDVQAFKQWWEVQASTPGGRQSTKFLPPDSKKLGDHSRKDQDFASFELQAIRRLCALFRVQPASIGYVGEQYKVTQESSMDAGRRVGVGAILQARKEFYDDLLRRLDCPDFEVLDDDDDIDRRAKEVDIKVKRTGGAYVTVNEARAEEGLPPLEGGDTLASLAMAANMEDAEEEEPDVDPESSLRAFNPLQPRDTSGRWTQGLDVKLTSGGGYKAKRTFKDKDSSQIRSIGYDSVSATLTVTFKDRKGGPDTTYTYDHVPLHVAETGLALDASKSSPGTWFNDQVRSKGFVYKKIA